MKKNSILVLILFCFISIFSIKGIDVYANNSFCGEGTTFIGEYKLDEYENRDANIDYSVEKTGLYKLTTKLNNDKYYYYMTVYSSTGYEIWSENGRDSLSCDAIYLKAGEKYRVNINVNVDSKDDILDKEATFESRFIKNVDLDLVADCTFKDEYNNEYLAADIKKKGLSWDSKTQTLTMNNCKLNGRFVFNRISKDYAYDESKYFPKACINVIGNNTLTTYCDDLIEFVGVDLEIKGNGTLNLKKRLDEDISDYGAICGVNYSSVIISDIKLNVDSYEEGVWAENISFDNVNASFKIHNNLIHNKKGNKVLYYSVIRASEDISINKSNICFEFDLLEKKYEAKKYGKKTKATIVTAKRGEISNSILDVKASKNLVSKFKKGTIKVVDNATVNSDSKIKYNVLKSYRNGLEKGAEIKKDGLVYKVLKSASTDKKYVGELAYCGYELIAEGSLKIPDTIVDCACEYKVVKVGKINFSRVRNTVSSYTIGKNIKVIDKKAFAKCKNLSKVIIKSKSIKKIGKKAFVRKGNKKITFEVPKGMKKKYTKLLKNAKIKNFVVVEK